MIIQTSEKDVIWSYVGTIVSMASSFILLPLLLLFLSDEEIGLWYIYVALANLTALFEFGFNPTFARNIVYCVSGVKGLSREGAASVSESGDVDRCLLARLMKTCKLVYAAIAAVTFVLTATLGSAYVAYIARDLPPRDVWLSWAIVVVSIFINLYYLYALTFLRGFGDIEGENKAKCASRLSQIAISALLLACGLGLSAAAIGLFVNGIVMRAFALRRLRRRQPLVGEARRKKAEVSREDLADTLNSVWHIAWRDGVVQLSSYASGQAMSIVCSLFLGLGEAGIFSICSQFSGAVIQFSNAFVKSYYPAFQSAYARCDLGYMRRILERGLAIYYIGALVGTAGVTVCLLPLLPLIRPGYSIDVPFFLAMTLFNFLSSQYSIFCNLIVNTNRIPYMWSYLVSGVGAIALASAICAFFNLGMWGILVGQAVAQAVYNFWKWPKFMLDELETTLITTLRNGLSYWSRRALGGSAS